MTTVTLHKGGTKECTIDAKAIQIPDLWHIAMTQDNKAAEKAILEAWHLAHNLKDHIQGNS